MRKFQGTVGRSMSFGLLFLSVTASGWAAGPEFDQARKLYSLTEFRQSLEILRAIPEKDAAVYELMGLNFYGEADYKKATEALEKAAVLDPASSEINMWLGRAFGRRAETSNLLSAPGHASKA